MKDNSSWFDNSQEYIQAEKIEDRKCDMFGCFSVGFKSHQIAPGTQVFLCQDCLNIIIKEEGKDAYEK